MLCSGGNAGTVFQQTAEDHEYEIHVDGRPDVAWHWRRLPSEMIVDSLS